MDRQPSLPRHIATLDGLRGLAAVAVLWFHFPQVGESRVAALFQDLSQKTRSGSLAVDVFFVLSGFLITRIILREVTLGRFSLKNFLIKRSLRIFPIYYLTLAILAGCGIMSAQWLPAAGYVSNYTIALDPSPDPLGHTWSLAVEEQFYLFWPVLFVLLPVVTIRRLAWPFIPIASIVVAALTFLTLEPDLAWGLVYRGLPYRALSLLLGATFAFHESSMRRWPARWLMLAAGTSYMALLGVAFGFQQTTHSAFRLVGFIASASTSLFTVMWVVGLNEQSGRLPGRLRQLLTSGPLLLAGRLSYGIYLYHYILLMTLFTPLGVDPRSVTLTLVESAAALFLCLAVPIASSILVEQPILKLKARLTPPLLPKAIPELSLSLGQQSREETTPVIVPPREVTAAPSEPSRHVSHPVSHEATPSVDASGLRSALPHG